MAQRDSIDNAVKQALVKDGWKVTDDPYVITYGERFLFVDSRICAKCELQPRFHGRKSAYSHLRLMSLSI